ncbi:toxin-antitoxin system YwqK family antitoxin [Sebaldella sp. S0638]|uniref:toxin-antitoxin system YwqK family antitoxin n=1 Tax=Sebaldella sp. S0638 TaxID=2957809 RepID=UPI00209CFC81|nr:hypothetical protein [Sebaldella sp. S0638]MCP1224022.1 hypothetical protein [Sebaldella sp. S0638]
MKKILLVFLFLFAAAIGFSYESTGLKVYDELNYKKGTFITYVDETGAPVSDKLLAKSYKRAYKQKDGVKVIADFYISTNTPELIYQTGKNNVVQGLFVKYYENGNIYSKGTYKAGKPDGDITYYDENGNVEQVDKYENGELVK